MQNLTNLTDKELLALCQKYGTQAILWKRKFIGLLPEVDRRRLYEKKKCVSIYEFAAKFGGVTKKHTQRVIQIDKAFEEKGVKVLREMLQEGAVGISKLIKVVSVIGMIEEWELAAAIKKLSCRSLETYVVDLRRAAGNYENSSEMAECVVGLFWSEEVKNHGGVLSDDMPVGEVLSNDGTQIKNGSREPLFEGKSVRVNTFADGVGTELLDKVRAGSERKIERENAGKVGTNEVKMQDQKVALKKIKLNLSEEVLEELLELQGKGINIDVLLKEFLQNREENIAEKKEETVKKVIGREGKRKEEGKKPVRKISVGVKRILKEEYGTKCAVNGCNKAATQIHHTVPFALSGSNDPNLLKPLCRAHHDIVHSMNTAYVGKKGMDLRTESGR